MPWKLTNSYCRKCAHPHRVMLSTGKTLRCPFTVRKGVACKCRKFVPLPREAGKAFVVSFQEWIDKILAGDWDPPPFSPLKRLSRRARELYQKVDAKGKIIL